MLIKPDILTCYRHPGACTRLREAVDSAKLDKIVLEAINTWKVPGAAVAIIQNDGVLLSKGYGVKKAGSNDPVTPKTMTIFANRVTD